MTGRRIEWDDARLAAAFASRAEGAPSTPPDLVSAVRARIAGAPRVRRGSVGSRLAPTLGLAAAVGLAVVVGVGQLAPTAPVASSQSSPSVATTAPPGLTILSVAEAIAVRDGGPGDREIAVRGWFSPALPIPCPAPPRSVNPVRLQCPFTTQWLLDTPEPLAAGRNTPGSGRAGFQALLPFLDATPLLAAARPATTEARLPEVVLIGHFHDRRGHGALCDVPDPAACAGFVADGIHSIDGVRAASSTIVDMEPWEPEPRREATWTPADVDRLFRAALPSLEILSRVAVPGHRISQIEPALGTGALGIIDRDVVWSVTGIGVADDGRPVRRTFLVVDGTAEAFESASWDVSNIGFVPFPLVLLPPEPTPTRTTSPTLVVTPEVDFPETWGGLPVQSVAEAIAELPEIDDSRPRAVAIKGWYVLPDPMVECPELSGIPAGPVEQPCPEGRHWLLEAPERLWDDAGPAWIDRQPAGPALNPIVPADVPFDLPNLWFDTGPYPLPVVVIGHFRDPRTSLGGNPDDLVVDALVWRAGAATANAPVGPVDGAVDDPLAVMIRVQRDAGSSIDAWLSLITGVALVEDDPSGDPLPPELATAERVWVVRRLVERQEGGAAIERAYTADGSERVWSSSLCCMVWLETKLLTALGGPPILETTDYPDEIVDIRPGLPEGAASWIEGQGPPETGTVMLGVIEGRPNELRIAWIGSECDRTWQLTWWANEVLLWPRERQLTCSEAGVRREVVLTLDHPVDLEAISVSNGGTGG